MKKWIVAVTCLLSVSPLAQAEPLSACNEDSKSVTCQAYLEGVVDGAMIYQPNAVGARLESEGYKARALKYRGGKRYQEANRMYCSNRLPSRDTLVSAVTEAVTTGEIKDIESLDQAVRSLLDCQRLN